MYFPILFDLLTEERKIKYDGETISKIDNFFGDYRKGMVISEIKINSLFCDVLKTSKLIYDLQEIGLIRAVENDDFLEPYEEKYENFIIEYEPNISFIEKEYDKYEKDKRLLDSVEIIYKRAVKNKRGVALLVDVKGYSKNLNDNNTNLAIHLFIDEFQEFIDKTLKKIFLVKHSGIEIKRNADGWFLYFVEISSAKEFIQDLIKGMHKKNSKIYKGMNYLGLSIIMYLHYINIEKVFKKDYFNIDIEGRDIVLIYMLEKPIEEILVKENFLSKKESSFIVITKPIFDLLLDIEKKEYKCIDSLIEIRDSENKNKIYKPNIETYYKEV